MAVPKPDDNGDYDSPPLKALRRVWADFQQGKADEHQAMDTIAEVGRFAQHNTQLLESQIESGVSDPDDPAFALILEAFDLVGEACEYMALEFVEPEPEDEIEEPEQGFFPFGLELLQEATNQMMEGHLLAVNHIQAISKVNCPFCSHSNTRDDARCGRCGRSLPQAPGNSGASSFSAVQTEGLQHPGSSGEPGQVTENYVTVAQAVAGWRSGNLSAQELSATLDRVEEKFLAHGQDTERQFQEAARAPQARRQALEEAIGLTQDALAMSLDAITRMRLAFDKEDDTYLELGLSDLETASRKMVESYQACKRAAQP